MPCATGAVPDDGECEECDDRRDRREDVRDHEQVVESVVM